ncbi:unnamed protein product [Linum tenue]|uniref:Uncharacterized protein n=1 Tax=Linum tenue TaxID=586396 RepID=A0AAV0M5V5_9ROSI|nr:unnamed protein product [Linum tenue]
MMDSLKEPEMVEIPESRRTSSCFRLILRLVLLLLFPFFAFLLLSISTAFIAVLSGQLSITTPVSVASRCRIVSSGVDLRSSKVCELGLLKYKTKNVFHPFDRNKFRCRYDYYWASVFEVEYEDHSLGRTRHALAEAPSEALPLNCRPNFAAAWMAKDKFKVNETYNCWHRDGISQVSLYVDDFHRCNSKDPSLLEIINQYIRLLIDAPSSLFIQKTGNATRFWKWEAVAGAVTGFLTSLITIFFFSVVQMVMPPVPQTWAYIVRVLNRAINLVVLKRACFFVAYFSFMGWLTIQYGKRLGMPEIRVGYI